MNIIFKMTIDDDVKEIMNLWDNIEHDIKWDLGKIWLEKDKLQVMGAEIEQLESKVVHLLKIIRTLKHDRKELKKHMEQLLGLLHHIKPTSKWQQEIKEELDEIAKEIFAAEEKVRQIIIAKRDARKSPTIPLIKVELAQVEGGINPKSVKCGYIIGKWKNAEIFELKTLYFHGSLARQNLSQIWERTHILDKIKGELEKCRNDDPINSELIFDFGNSWPKYGQRPFRRTESGVVVETYNQPVEFRSDFIPEIELSIRKISVDQNTRPLTLKIEAYCD